MRIVVMVALGTCAGRGMRTTTAETEATAPPPLNPTPRPQRVVDPTAMCKRMQELHDMKCGTFAEFQLGDTCVQEVQGTLSDPRGNITTGLMDACISELTTCSDIVACVGSLDAGGDLRECGEHSELKMASAVGVPYDAWRTAMKRGVTQYSQVMSTKDKPLELCGVTTENLWLVALECDDHSHPLPTRSAAELARKGNVGAGGRCNAVIDHYRVTCPEHPYDLYIDAYVCPDPEQ